MRRRKAAGCWGVLGPLPSLLSSTTPEEDLLSPFYRWGARLRASDGPEIPRRIPPAVGCPRPRSWEGREWGSLWVSGGDRAGNTAQGQRDGLPGPVRGAAPPSVRLSAGAVSGKPAESAREPPFAPLPAGQPRGWPGAGSGSGSGSGRERRRVRVAVQPPAGGGGRARCAGRGLAVSFQGRRQGPRPAPSDAASPDASPGPPRPPAARVWAPRCPATRPLRAAVQGRTGAAPE